MSRTRPSALLLVWNAARAALLQAAAAPRPRLRRPLVVALMLGVMLLLGAEQADAATFNVEDPASVGDDNPGDGVCRSKLRPGTILRRCTLNAAVEEANALSGFHTILVPAGTFRFDDNECFFACGFMTVTGRMAIVGAGPSSTTIKSIALFGHGILVRPDARLDLRNLTYSDNSRIENVGGTLNIENAVLRDNRSAFGGALALRPGSGDPPGLTTIVNTRITGNRTFGAGASGAIFVRGGALNVRSSSIDGNVAECSNCTGAMTMDSQFAFSVVDLINVTISGNSEAGGGAGGLGMDEGRLSLRNVTVANNSRGGLVVTNSGSLHVLQSTLFAGNGDLNCHNVRFRTDINFQNLDSGATCEFNNDSVSNVDPKLGPLQDNGGPTPTHALLAGSPAIDAATCIVLTDQRGFTRPLDGDNDGQARCDIGAFERPRLIQVIIPPIGVGAVSPPSGTTNVGDTYPITYTWDVPTPTNWGAVGSLDLRLVSNGQLALWLRWDQLLDTFQLLDAGGNRIGFALPGGLDVPLSSGLVTLDTARAKAAGSGITGQRTTLTLPLRFSEAAAGKVFTIEISARDDDGRPEPFRAAGAITVLARSAAVPVANAANNDDEPKDQPPRLTEEQRRQRERTNRGGKDDEHTEGHAVATRCDLSPPEVDIASRDGTVTLLLRRDAVAACRSVKPGDYVEADGEKVHEQRYCIDDLDVRGR